VGTTMEDGCPLDPHPHTHTYSIPSASLVGASAGKDLRWVIDGCLSYSDALCAGSLGRRCRGHKEGASNLSSPIRVVERQY